MVRFISRFFYDTKRLCLLLTLNDKLHLVSIENTLVKNKKKKEMKVFHPRYVHCSSYIHSKCISVEKSKKNVFNGVYVALLTLRTQILSGIRKRYV